MTQYTADGQEILYRPGPAWRLSLPEQDRKGDKQKEDQDPLILIPSPTLTQLTGFPNKPVLTFEHCRDLLLTSLGNTRLHKLSAKEEKSLKDEIFTLFDDLNEVNKGTSKELFLILFVYAVRQYLDDVSRSSRGIILKTKADKLPTPNESDMKTYVVAFFKKLESNPQHQIVLITNFVKSVFSEFLYEISIGNTNDSLRQNPNLVNEIYDKLDSQFHMTENPLKAITFFSCINSSATLDLSYDLYPPGYDSSNSPGRPFISGVLRLYIQAVAIMTAYY